MTKKWTAHAYQCTILKYDQLSETLNFQPGTLVLHATLSLTVLHICAKLFQNPLMNDKHMDRTHLLMHNHEI